MGTLKFFLRATDIERMSELSHTAGNENSTAGISQENDSSLVALTANGDINAFTVLVERHTSALYRVSYRMLRDETEAEDVVQECFTRLWTCAPNWREKGVGLVGWLHRVTVNLCHDQLRKPRSVISDVFSELVDTAPRADAIMQAREVHSAIECAVASLPLHYRTVIILSYYEGFPNAVVAEAMDMNIKALESLLGRARRQLRKVLEAQEFAAADLEVLI